MRPNMFMCRSEKGETKSKYQRAMDPPGEAASHRVPASYNEAFPDVERLHSMYEDLCLYINGEFLKGGGRREQDVIDPATD